MVIVVGGADQETLLVVADLSVVVGTGHGTKAWQQGLEMQSQALKIVGVEVLVDRWILLGRNVTHEERDAC